LIRSTASNRVLPWAGRGGRRRVLPGFGLSLGFALTYLGALVLLPLAGLVYKASGQGWGDFVDVTTSDRALAAYRLTLTASAVAAAVNGVFGTILAWVLVRYRLPGRLFIDALVDFPLALPTAVAGLTYTSLYVPNGWIGQYLDIAGIKVAYTQLGIMVVLTFIALPFVVRTVQPVIQALDVDVEEAAATLGANRLQVFWRVIIPSLLPSILTGTALGFARAVGEYGSVIFIAGNIPRQTEIAPLLVVIQLEEFDYAGAAAIALVLLVISFVTVGGINLLSRMGRHER
jgi:sulfate transport system permease protein